jgi:hypothetical protein
MTAGPQRLENADGLGCRTEDWPFMLVALEVARAIWGLTVLGGRGSDDIDRMAVFVRAHTQYIEGEAKDFMGAHAREVGQHDQAGCSEALDVPADVAEVDPFDPRSAE